MPRKHARYPGIEAISDGRKRIRLRAVDPRTGRMKEVDRIITASMDDAIRLREEWRGEIRNADHYIREVPRLRDYVRSWLRSRAIGLKPSTAKTYAETLGAQVLPSLGDFFLDKLTDTDVREWQSRLAETLKPATVNGALVMLRMVLADAVAEYRLARNPATRVRRLRVRTFTDEEPNLLTGEELARVLTVFRDHFPKHYPLAVTLAFTGMRFGEATALKWSDIDEGAGLIRVARAQWSGKVSTTKTGIVRTVALAPHLASVLQQHRARLEAASNPGQKEGWVFPGPGGGFLPRCVLRWSLRQALRLAGITKRVTTHGLRRTFNNLSRQLNGEIVTRSMTGHVTVAMTEHYSHVGRDEKLAAVAKIAEAVALPDRSGGSGGGSSDPASTSYRPPLPN